MTIKQTSKKIVKPLRKLVKTLGSHISSDTYQRLMGYAILKNEFQKTKTIPVFETREKLWDDFIENRIGVEANITYVEFGVHRGYSIRYFSERNTNKESTFTGLDSFEGLPEDWSTLRKGTFDTKGDIPLIDDRRVSFIKGWFQDTWDELYSRLVASNIDNLIVHYDADLYSSTLFALSKIDNLKKSYIAIFDEFTGDETVALFNYLKAYNADVSFLTKTVYSATPNQLICRIIPTSNT